MTHLHLNYTYFNIHVYLSFTFSKCTALPLLYNTAGCGQYMTDNALAYHHTYIMAQFIHTQILHMPVIQPHTHRLTALEYQCLCQCCVIGLFTFPCLINGMSHTHILVLLNQQITPHPDYFWYLILLTLTWFKPSNTHCGTLKIKRTYFSSFFLTTLFEFISIH